METNRVYILAEAMKGEEYYQGKENNFSVLENVNIAVITTLVESLKHRRQSIMEVAISFVDLENFKAPIRVHHIGGEQNTLKLLLEVG